MALIAEEKSESSSSSSSVAVVSEEPKNEEPQKKDLSLEGELSGESGVSGTESKPEAESDAEKEEKEKLQELDWKSDENFKKFMRNPSIEAAIKLEKKRTDRKLKELNRETSDNPILGFFNKLARDNLPKEKERLEKAEEAFKALDLNKLKSCFGFHAFFATNVRIFGDGEILIGNTNPSSQPTHPSNSYR
nr:probable zinc metallopeptidase EGY3, chloroplastic [Coffea arabica]